MKSSEFIARIVRGQEKQPRDGSKYVSSVMFDGRNVYSYGYHYPLLVRLDTEAGPHWILNDRGYSSSTGRHIHWAQNYADARVHLPRGSSSTDARSILEAVDIERAEIAEYIAATEKKIKERPRYAHVYTKNIERARERNAEIQRARDIACSAIDHENTIKQPRETNMENIYNPDICPSSLDEFGEPMTEGETAHKWDETTSPVTCSECGTTK